MEKSLKLVNEDYYSRERQTSFRCSGCKGVFQEPILATVSLHGDVQKYYACPRCLSKISEVKHNKSEEDKETSILTEKIKKAVVAKDEDNVKCKHFLGYLKSRPKDVQFPDECLTCDKMIECLTH